MKQSKNVRGFSSSVQEIFSPQTQAGGKKLWRTPQLSILPVPDRTQSGMDAGNSENVFYKPS